MKIINQSEFNATQQTKTNLFISNSWLKVISKTYGFEFKAVFDEKSNLFIPFCFVEDEYYKAVKSVPFGDYTFLNCNKLNTFNKGLDLLRQLYPKHYIETTIVHKDQPEKEFFSTTKIGFLIQIDIQKWRESRDWKEAYERNIRTALNYGLSVKISKDLDSLTGFYNLHERLRINKFNKLPQPFRFFINIYNEFVLKDNGFLLEAWNRDVLISSWFVLKHQNILYYKFGASNADYLHLRPNDLLFRSLMQYGSDNNYTAIDLGFSGASKSYEGLIRFKSKEGGEKLPIYHLEYFPDSLNSTIYKEKANYLNSLTKKIIGSNDINQIRQFSNENYHRFA